MFEVKDKMTGKVYTVYSVVRGVEITTFLIYNEFIGWLWASSTVFIPVNGGVPHTSIERESEEEC